MKHLLIAATAMIMASSAQAQIVQVGQGDWSSVPAIQARGQLRLGDTMLARLHDLGAQQVCNVRGLSRRLVDLTVPFVIRFTPQGEVEQIVVRNTGCPQLESIVAGAVLQMARAGEYRPTGENLERWYRSELSFVSR